MPSSKKVMRKPQNPYFSKTIEKGLKILNLFNQNRTSLTLKEISQDVDINKTSAFRFANTLIQLGYLRKDPKTRLLKLGPKALFLSHSLMKSFDLLQIIKPFIDDAYKRYNNTIDSALLDGNTILILYRREAKDTLTFRLPPVTTALYCTALGKAALAHIPENEILAIIEQIDFIKKTKNSLVNKEALMTDLKKTRKRGYSLNNEEYVLGLISIGAPLLNMEANRAIGAISFDFSTAQYSLNTIERKYAKTIVKLAKDISAMIPIM